MNKLKVSKFSLFMVVSSLLFFLLIIISLLVGRYSVSPNDAFSVISSKILGNPTEGLNTTVVWEIRLPRLILASFVGAGLAASGAAFQGCFYNPLVSPDILGVSSGAGFGASLGILLTGLSTGLTGVLAFSFGLLSVFLSWLVSRLRRSGDMLSLVLAGVIVSAVFSALMSLVKLVADVESQLPAITFWLMGSFAGATLETLKIVVVPISLGLLILIILRWRINLLTLGDEEAKSLGISPGKIRFIVIISATIITATSVMASGIVGWVGLIVPNLCRILVGADYRKLLPASCIIGAIFMLIVDFMARSVTAAEIPIGILTALIGAPFFAIVYIRGGRE